VLFRSISYLVEAIRNRAAVAHSARLRSDGRRREWEMSSRTSWSRRVRAP